MLPAPTASAKYFSDICSTVSCVWARFRSGGTEYDGAGRQEQYVFQFITTTQGGVRKSRETDLRATVHQVAGSGATPLVVADKTPNCSDTHLKDIVKGGIASRN